jgi:hypothetical protein
MRRKKLSPISVIAVLALVLIAASRFPILSAYGSGENWQLGFSGTGNVANMGFGFWGWCTFVGGSSGTDADCQVSQYLHTNGNGDIQCETAFNITNWDAQAGVLQSLGVPTEFFANSGTITVHPANATPACTAFLQAAGFNVAQTGPSTITIEGPSDMALPASAGHYNFNNQTIEGVFYKEFQVQVSEKS